MRRLAAVFAKRSDKSDAGSNASTADRVSAAGSHKTTSTVKSRSGLFRGLTKGSTKEADAKARKHHPMPPVSTIPPDHAASSSSSSSGGPTTPSDDHESLGHHTHGKKMWIPFLSDKALVAPGVPSPLPNNPHGPYLPHSFVHSQEDVSSLSSKSASADDGPLPPPKLSNSSPPLSPVVYFRVITTNALVQPFSPPPLLQVPNGPLYPRSSNPSRVLAPSDSLRVRMQRKHLLARLDVTDLRALAPFAQRQGVPAKSKRLSLVLDDVALRKGQQVLSFSQGLRRWAERPCFEDRMIIYLPSEDGQPGVRYEPVSSTTAVEALEYSDELELLAALDEAPVQDAAFSPVSPTSLTPELSLTPSTASLSSMSPSPPLASGSTSSLNAATNTKVFPSVMYKTAPSPLRIASSDPPPRLLSQPSPRSISSPALSIPASLTAGLKPSRSSPVITPSIAQSVKPAVHFAEDDKDESIPLDYVMRIKQARDQKAKFLAAERARRMDDKARGAASKRAEDDRRQLVEERRRLEEARKKHEEERRKQDLERKRFEQERAAFEREKRAAEEEKKQKIIFEELAEARRRRESQRSGPAPRSNDGAVAWEGDREKERERRKQEARGSYSRAKYDDSPLPTPRRQSSETNVNLSSSPSRPTIPFANSSPGSSRPASLVGSQRGSSRPPSMYSTPPSSSSDIRVRRESKASRRTSIVSDTYAQPQQMYFQAGTPPGMLHPWMVPPVPALPVGSMPLTVSVPMMAMPMAPMGMGPMGGMGPMYTEMPLLPPSAPFMMQQFGQRSHGQRSHSASPTRGHTPSSEKGSTHSRDSPSDTHRRRPSGDASVVTSGGKSPQPHPQYSASSLRTSRSGNPALQQQHAPTPPTSFQRPVPVATPTYSRTPGFENLSRPQSNRRQTMIT